MKICPLRVAQIHEATKIYLKMLLFPNLQLLCESSPEMKKKDG
jgi:hypothetical protein